MADLLGFPLLTLIISDQRPITVGVPENLAALFCSSMLYSYELERQPRPDRVKGLYRATRAPRRALSLRDKAGKSSGRH